MVGPCRRLEVAAVTLESGWPVRAARPPPWVAPVDLTGPVGIL